MIIEAETAAHYQAVRRVTEEAFATSEFGYHGEAELIDELRTNCAECPSLVALNAGEVVGHIFFSPAEVRYGDRKLMGMGLGPMSVLPRFQHQGIGSALVQAGLAELKQRRIEFTVVIGHPEFYQRFGFEPAESLGIKHGFEGIPQEFLLLRPEGAASPFGAKGGLVFYRSEFGNQFPKGSDG